MSNKQPTAVEWLYIELFYFLNSKSKFEDADEILEKAKEIEKEQIKKAVNFGDERGNVVSYSTAEQYYEETYGGNK